MKLNHPISEYRLVLSEWVKKRREGPQLTVYTEAPEYINWPDFPKPPPRKVEVGDCSGNRIFIDASDLAQSRRDKREKGIPILNWERPAQHKLPKKGIVCLRMDRLRVKQSARAWMEQRSRMGCRPG
ncbi:hypothetical protein DL546_005295 [Coniochaeta pulveracea]|uniref:Uncharacterized protein n=1 Tax=Coniochaeta pulveracea TaxID=177199 RepID=A0A420YGF8_9PEZI|nr:hypothetical protein DL546_005295 [Coniochaeta pulveracea]